MAKTQKDNYLKGRCNRHRLCFVLTRESRGRQPISNKLSLRDNPPSRRSVQKWGRQGYRFIGCRAGRAKQENCVGAGHGDMCT